MKLLVVSDLHLKFSEFRAPAVDFDVVIFAGDVSARASKVPFWACRANNFGAVLDHAETATETACLLCGKPATINLHGAWWACLCEFHTTERRVPTSNREASGDAAL